MIYQLILFSCKLNVSVRHRNCNNKISTATHFLLLYEFECRIKLVQVNSEGTMKRNTSCCQLTEWSSNYIISIETFLLSVQLTFIFSSIDFSQFDGKILQNTLNLRWKQKTAAEMPTISCESCQPRQCYSTYFGFECAGRENAGTI